MAGQDDEQVLNVAVKQSMKTIRSAIALAAQDIPFCRTLSQEVSQNLDITSSRIEKVAHDLLELMPSMTGQLTGVSSSVLPNDWKVYSDKLDNIFEEVEQMFDQASKRECSGTQAPQMIHLDDELHDNNAINAKQSVRIEKPQLNFNIKVDNSELEPFKPKLKNKPHALVLYEESTSLTDGKEENGKKDPDYYPHPYEYEIDHQPYPERILQILEPVLPTDWNTTSATWVENEEQLKEMMSDLSQLNEIAVDLEHHDYRSFLGIVCLMQISNRDKDWIIDTLKLRESLHVLNEIFANPQIVKVFHGAFMDIIWLQRDLGLYVVSLFDTYHASKKLRFLRFSLAYLLENYANFKTSKKYQLADWRVRPLPGPMLSYARSDTHFLLYVYDQLRNKLVSENNESMQEVLYDSRQVAKRRFEYTKYRPSNISGSRVSCPVMAPNPSEPFGSIMNQFNLPNHTKPIVEALYNWRDAKAKEFDELARYIMPNQLLVNFSLLHLPTSEKELLRNSHLTKHVRQFVKELAELLNSTIKKVTDSEWAMVDNWNKSSGVSLEESIIEDSLDLRTIAMVFDSAIEHKTDVLLKEYNFNTHSQLLGPDLSGDVRAISYDISKRLPILHGSQEVKLRVSQLIKESPLIDSLPKELDKPENKILATTVKSDVLEDDDIDEAPAKKLFDNEDEIVALRKRAYSRPQRPDKIASTEKLLYSDSPILEKSDGPKPRTKKGKRSFDPNAAETLGPQPAKRTKKLQNGKSLTFKSSNKF